MSETTSAPVLPGPPEAVGSNLAAHWHLDPEVTFLNHGCFGSCPRHVLEAQTAWRDRIEARPIELLDRRRDALLEEAKAAVGRFLGARPDDFGFVSNATGGVNAVLRCLELNAGDEIVTTTHVYNAVRQTLRHVCERSGSTVVEAAIPMPISGPDVALEAVEAVMSDRTRLVLVDHLTSPTALLLPIEAIISRCAKRGVDVLVDGAHAPGMLELDIERLGCAYYTGNLHKWVCCPKGTAFLWVRADRQAGIHPGTISHFLGEGLAREFSWQGTRDITGWLCAPEAIEFFARLGWDRVRRHNHEMATWAQAYLASRWGVEPATPLDGSMLGSMVTLPLPETARQRWPAPAAFQAALYELDRIEVPVIDFGEGWWVRVSCQVYNVPEHYERLADAVIERSRRGPA
jgi:isopenicillin-N epimerase